MPDDLRDLMDLMSKYSRRGMEDWKAAADDDLRTSARECLSNAIAENDWDVSQTINGGPNGRKFIPVPNQGYEGFEWGFFLPNRDRGSGDLKSLILFLLVDHESRRCLAFRFEGDSSGPHGYAHVQMTWNFKKLHLPSRIGGSSNLINWLPESYPAFPVSAKTWTEMFFVMATSVHGRDGGINTLIQEIFQGDNARRYKKKLDKALFQLQLDTHS